MKTNMHYPEIKTTRFHNLATDYLKNSGKDKYYTASYTMRDDVSDIDGIEFYVKVNDEQIDDLNVAIAEAKAQDMNLSEYWDFEVPEYLQQENSQYGQWYDIETVNLDEVYIRIPARVAHFPLGLDSGYKVFNTAFYLSKEEYLELLTWQMSNRYGNYNDLIVDHPELYAVINGQIRGIWNDFDIVAPIATPIFTVELTGIQDDAKTILGDKPIGCTTWEYLEKGNIQQCVLTIDENNLIFFYQSSIDGIVYSKRLENIDALAVENMLGVNSYQAIAEWLTQNAKGEEGVDKFQKMLDKGSIAYEVDVDNYNI